MISTEPLDLVHSELIESIVESNEVPLDIFSLEEVLGELLDVYSHLLLSILFTIFLGYQISSLLASLMTEFAYALNFMISIRLLLRMIFHCLISI